VPQLDYCPPFEERQMNREQFAADLEKFKGRMKVWAGILTADKTLEAEGNLDWAAGNALRKLGDARAARATEGAVRRSLTHRHR
jgi:uncharacterized protein YjbJ (UPF0337 family)